MNRIFLALCGLLFLASCQKEISFEAPDAAEGSLLNTSGDCFPQLLSGTYTVNKNLADSNSIAISVVVTKPGAYKIATDTVNGYSFSASGTFTVADTVGIILKGSGKPVAAGIDDFTIQFDNTFCFFSVSVDPGGGSSGSAVFALQGTPGSCINANIAGTYPVGTPLTTANTVTVDVNVTTLGTWAITTGSVAGFSFAGAGTFTTTGVQQITLTASGNPTSGGAQTFAIIAGASSCNFTVTVAGAGPAGVFALAGAPGNCTSATIAGTFRVGTALTAANTVTLGVIVATVGTWSITTTAVTGITFSGSGTFTTAGAQNVVLTATGNPTTAGIQTIAVTAGGTNCSFPVTVLAAAGPAVFTLQGAPGNCTAASVAGTYTVGAALAAANTVTLNVNVTSIGTWTVSIAAVTGISFSGSGTFTTTGAQQITLNGTGNPTTAGAQTFSVTAGGTTCTFPVTVGAAGAPGVYFPLTLNSYWTFDDNFSQTTPDTAERINVGNVAINGLTYMQQDWFENDGTNFYYTVNRKDASGNYYEYAVVDDYSLLSFSTLVEADLLFLKDVLTTNQMWLSAEYSGTDSLGTPKKLRYSFTCINNNATETVNSKTFTNVYKITMQPQVSTSGGAFANEPVLWEIWYAKNIGMIYTKVAFGTTILDMKIRRWQVF